MYATRNPRSCWRGTLLPALLIVLLCGLVGRQAWAGEAAEFQRHFKKAMTLYKANDLEGSLKEFHAAYAIKQLPKVVLNIGQIQRKLGHAREALGFYELYLRVEPNPKPEIRTELEAYIKQSRDMLASAERIEAERAAAEKQQQEQEQAQQDQARDDQARQRALAEQARKARQTAEAAAGQDPAAPVGASGGRTRPDLLAPAAAPTLATAPALATASTRGARVALVPSGGAGQAAPPRRKRTALWIGLGVAAGVLVAGAVTAGVLLGSPHPASIPTLTLENLR